MSADAGLAAAAVSVVAGGLLGGAVFALVGHRQTVAQRVGAYVTLRHDESDSEQSLVERALGDRKARKLARSPLLTRLRTEMEVAEIDIGLEQLLGYVVVAILLVGGLLVLKTHSPVAALLALVVPGAALMAIRMRADRKRRMFADQLPDNLQVIASAMRSGQTFVGALKAVLEDAPEPSARELRRAVLDEQLGIPLADALAQVTERMRSQDFKHVAIVASLQRETGGNTAEVIELVAETVRQRIEIRRLVRSLTAQGRLSGGVLAGLPVALLLFISLINPGYVRPLYHTTMGLVALGVSMGLVVCGGFVIRKIIKIEV
ncbi:type II secretion system F family protein [Conexibacter sp. S30A1]|uniref:type II secretion system F family protein n=1 Tax=Conexibacter sp. S30A1 TaxID=2937800 RepID=UPI00200BE58E|nr:type II secretion system F family protein [Conexibacter sp. S30A1]